MTCDTYLYLGDDTYLGYNCIEFENFTASIGNLMVAN